MHWHHEVFVLKGVLIHIHTLGHGDPKVFEYDILSKMSETIQFILKRCLQVQISVFSEILSKYGKIPIRSCPHTGKYGSEKARISAYFIQ